MNRLPAFTSSIRLKVIFLILSLVNSGSYAQDNWIGVTPDQLAPNSRPLGKMTGKSYQNAKPAKPTKAKNAEINNQENQTPVPQNKDFNDFHSNLGRQAIVEKIEQPTNQWIGATPDEILPGAKPLGSIMNRSFNEGVRSDSDQSSLSGEEAPPTQSGDTTELPVDLSVFGSVRPYYTTNVLRTREDEVESGVLENTIGMSLASKPLQMGQYITLVPHLDFLMQWANYGEESIKDLLNYRFGMVKGNLDFYLPLDFRISPGLEYDFLHSQFTGDKLFDAVAPSLSIQKIIGITDSTFLMFDGVFKYSSTEREINFVSNDIFPDDGDNIQLGFNLNLMQSFGPGGQFIIMPGLGITRTEYLKNNQDGRIDLIYFAGLSAIWQPLQWLSFQTFGNFSAMNTNSIGEGLLGKSSKFQAWDLGAAVTASHTF